MTVNELAKELSLREITVDDPEREIDGVYCGDLLSWVMGRAKSGNVWVTIMSNINVVAVASLCDVSAVVLAEGVELEDEVIRKAASQGINIYGSGDTAYGLCAKLGKLLD